MNAKLPWLLLAPPLLVAPPAHATVYLTLAQAQATLFPGETLLPVFRTLDAKQAAAIKQASGVAPLSPQLKAWRASGGGWLIIEQVIGKHDYITYALALDPSGAVKSVEIMEYRENYGDQVKLPKWRAQFVGKRAGAGVRMGKDIRNISGATLSCTHVTDGVRRLLATYAIVLAARG